MIAKTRDIRLFLDDIRSVHNAGSIFRTAETLGVSHIYCGGTTPTPLDRFKRKRADFAKVALGAEEMIAWEHVAGDDGRALLRSLKKEGFRVIALEQAERSVDYKEVDLEDASLDVESGFKALVILGNEVDGVSPELLKLADVIAEIPHAGKKESLNVSVAAGIFLYRLFDR